MAFHNTSKQEIYPEGITFGKGGEGVIYRVMSPDTYRKKVIKIYHSSERSTQKENKLNHLIGHRPSIKNALDMAWPEEVIFEEGHFVGFSMPLIESGFALSHLMALKVSSRLSPMQGEPYSRLQVSNLYHRARICANLARIIQRLHEEGYVLVDIKPENILVRPQGQISILDLDSLQVVHEGHLRFAAPKMTNEYAPPEAKQLISQTQVIPPSWDNFSLAIVFYKIMLGVHPFAVTGKGKYRSLSSHAEKIQEGLFPFGTKRDQIEVVPHPHQNFYSLPQEIQDLFRQTFGSGLTQVRDRPQAREWQEAWERFKPFPEKYRPPLKVEKVSIFKGRTKKPSWSKQTANDTEPMMTTDTVNWSMLIMFGVIIATNFSQLFTGQQPVRDKKPSAIEESFKTPTKKLEKGCYVFRDSYSGLYGIKFNEEIIVLALYHEIRRFDRGYAFFQEKKDGLWGLFDKKGNIISPSKHAIIEKLDNYSEYGYLQFYKDGPGDNGSEYAGIVNHKGQEIIAPNLYEVIEVLGGKQGKVFFRIKQEGKEGLMNAKGKIIAPLIYTRINIIKDIKGLVFKAISPQGKIALDSLGKEISVLYKYNTFEALPSKGELLFKVTLQGKTGIIDQQGKKILDFEYDNLSPSTVVGYYILEKSGKSGLFHEQGKHIIPLSKYVSIRSLSQKGYYRIRNKNAQGDFVGVVNDAGEVILGLEYDQAYFVNKDVIKTTRLVGKSKEERRQYFNRKGEPIQYEE